MRTLSTTDRKKQEHNETETQKHIGLATQSKRELPVDNQLLIGYVCYVFCYLESQRQDCPNTIFLAT